MNWSSLNLWETEQQLINTCITKALCELIASKKVKLTDEELVVTGKLRPFLARAKKGLKLAWVLQPEASCFAEEEDPHPEGHPDFKILAGNNKV